MFKIDMIIAGIKNGLTGDQVKDMMYLEDMAQKYADHEYGDRILKEIGIISFQILSYEDQKQYVTEQYQMIQESIEANEYPLALNRIEELLDKVLLFKEDGSYDVEEDIEAVVIYALTKQSIANAKFPYAKLYELKANIHVGLKQYEKAIEMINEAIKWNPGCVRYYFEKADIYRYIKDLDMFFEINLNTFPYICKKEYASKVYFNIGYYLIEKKDYENAIAALALSLNYDENENAYNELAYIQNLLGREIDQPTMKDLQRLSNQYHIPLSLNETVLSYIYTFGMQYLNRDRQKGEYFIKILYELTRDETLLGYLN